MALCYRSELTRVGASMAAVQRSELSFRVNLLGLLALQLATFPLSPRHFPQRLRACEPFWEFGTPLVVIGYWSVCPWQGSQAAVFGEWRGESGTSRAGGKKSKKVYTNDNSERCTAAMEAPNSRQLAAIAKSIGKAGEAELEKQWRSGCGSPHAPAQS